MEECYLLACSQAHIQLPFQPRHICLRRTLPSISLNAPTSVSQGNAHDQFDGDKSFRFPLSNELVAEASSNWGVAFEHIDLGAFGAPPARRKYQQVRLDVMI